MKPIKYRVYKHPAESFHVQDVETNKFLFIRMDTDGTGVAQRGSLGYTIEHIQKVESYFLGWRSSHYIEERIRDGKRRLIGEFSNLSEIARIQETHPEEFI
ncbi:hypothetical protein WCWAEYFT_CDS0107 [Vibrio phage VB_VaC_TDDLMA]